MNRSLLPLLLVLGLTTLAAAENPSPPVRPAGSATQPPAGEQPPEESILDLPLEQLSQVEVAPSLGVEVTSVSRTESTVGQSPAAIFVITNEMIRRSGARTIPEILRMAPGVNVARITANKWAVSIRGFNSKFANKLLVQIDGRTVYNPLFAGVYWDVQDVVLEDVDRIEVIRGPGATVWGANAVNGIINIITKHSRDTQGTLIDAGAGDEWEGFTTARYGGSIGKDLHYRVYGKWFERDDSITQPDYIGSADDNWRIGRGGFRMDWDPTCCDLMTVQGEYYDGFSGGQNLIFPAFGPPISTGPAGENVRGAFAIYRWTHRISDESDWSLQLFYDRTERRAEIPANLSSNDRSTYDVDFQYRFPIGANHDIISGFEYRYSDDFVSNSNASIWNPKSRALDVVSYFLQDKITLSQDYLYFIIGSKFSHNDYTDFEMQPSARILLTPDRRRTIWASVSRAVRTPSRADTDLTIVSPFIIINGNPAFRSEEVLAYELGMRAQPVDEFFWDVAMFYNDYTDLSGNTQISPPMFIPPFGPFIPGVNLRDNRRTHEQTWGFEVASNAQLTEDWQVRGAYSFIRGVGALGPAISETPRNQFYIQSSHDFGCHVFFDLIGRYVDERPGGDSVIVTGPVTVPRYFEMDARLAYRPNRNIEYFLVGRNLLERYHYEANADTSGTIGSEVPREFYGGATLRY